MSISDRMKREWDERIAHNYRFWMSDGVESDEIMMETGKRDLALLIDALDPKFLESASLLDLGCGVGRLTSAASNLCKEVIGLDVSAKAIETAKKLVLNQNVRFTCNNGINLSVISDNTIDIVISFATLGSIPAAVTASYLKDANRILKIGGVIRIQLYLGTEQQVQAEDTLSLRSYNMDRFIEALEISGFSADYIKEVELPFEVSDYEAGLVAYILGATKSKDCTASNETILSCMLETPEIESGDSFEGSESAYLNTLACAREQLNSKNINAAIESINFAKRKFNGSHTLADSMLSEILDDGSIIDKKTSLTINSEIIEIQTDEGVAYTLRGVPLSHLVFPKKAATAWAERCLRNQKPEVDTIILVGIGDGVFYSSLRAMWAGKLLVIEDESSLIELYKSGITSDEGNKAEIYDSSMLGILFSELDISNCEMLTLPASPLYCRDVVDKAESHFRSLKLNKQLNPSIGILGPLSGGTLPISGYIYDACRKLGRPTHLIDVSGHSNAFESLSQELTHPFRQKEMENKYVEMLSEYVLQVVEEKKIDILITVAQAPLLPKVLEQLKQKGVITAHWFMEDTRRFPAWQALAPWYDYFFLIQKGESLEEVKKAGARRTHYLPLACVPEIHTPVQLSPQEKAEFGSPISFVGAGYNNRRHVFSKLGNLDFKIWGTQWPDMLPFSKLVQRSGARISVPEYVKIFSASSVNLNLHSSQERDSIDPFGDFINPRVFELASCGAFQLSDNRSLMPELFEIGKEIVVFSSEKEMLEQIRHYLTHPEEARMIAERARKRVLQDHTYVTRMQTMLNLIFHDNAEHLLQRSKRSPWKQTLTSAEAYKPLYDSLLKVQSKGADPTLENVVKPILESDHELSDFEKKLLVLHHMGGQVTQIEKVRSGQA